MGPHASIADAIIAHINQPTVCRTATVEIPALQLEQLRAQSSHGLSMRNRKPTAEYAVIADDFDAEAAVSEFSQMPTRELAADEQAVRFAHLGRMARRAA